ncbi:MAG: tetratricopeptide repeat protein, partial [Opitutales bacterium]
MKDSTRNATITKGAVNLPWRSGIWLLVFPLCLGAVSCVATGDSFFGFPAPRDGQLTEVPTKEPKTATVHVRRAARLYQEERYEEAVTAVEAALAELPDVPQNGELREKLLSMHRLARAKALLANYRERINEIEDASIRRQALPGLVVTQTYGTVWQSDDGKRRKVLLGGNVTAKTTFFVRGESGLEITSERGGMIRAVDSSAFTFSADRCVRLNEGSILLHLPKDSQPFQVDGPLAGVTIESKKASTALLSVTTSGGLKIIAT